MIHPHGGQAGYGNRWSVFAVWLMVRLLGPTLVFGLCVFVASTYEARLRVAVIAMAAIHLGTLFIKRAGRVLDALSLLPLVCALSGCIEMSVRRGLASGGYKYLIGTVIWFSVYASFMLMSARSESDIEPSDRELPR